MSKFKKGVQSSRLLEQRCLVDETDCFQVLENKVENARDIRSHRAWRRESDILVRSQKKTVGSDEPVEDF